MTESAGGPARRLKVMTVVGTRPEVVKLSRVMAELDRHTEHVLVHSGQNGDYELKDVFFEELGLRAPDHDLQAAAPTAAETIAQVIVKVDQVLERERPDALLLYGDTNTCLAVIPAKRRRVPVFHMEAGNRSFDERVPEEINRRLVDHLSDVNLVLSEHARRHLLAEGRRPDTVIKVGSPMREVIGHYRAAIDRSTVLARHRLEPGAYFLVSAHREENVDPPANLARLVDTLNALAERHGQRVMVSLHPRTRRRLQERGPTAAALDPRVELCAPFGFLDYVKLELSASCVLSDSGTLTEEASLLGFPAVMIRESHERPEGMDEATVVMAGLGRERVLQAVDLVRAQAAAGPPPRRVPDYEAEDVSRKVVRIILSYVDYVNATVWRRG